MKVGIPFMKCSLNPSSQLSNTCQLGKAWREMNDERKGVDQDINKSLTYKNVWMEGDTRDDVSSIVQKKIDEINQIRNENGKRSIRKDAVSVVEMIEKPNIEYMKNLNYDEKIKFLNDSHRAMESLIKEWNPNWKIIESVQHHDEFGGLSAHNHSLILLTTIDKDGLPNFKAKTEFNTSFFNFVNKNYSLKMQEKGYEVENAEMYESLTKSEKQEKILKQNENGVSSYEYKLKKREELSNEIKEKENRSRSLDLKLEEKIVEITKAPSLEKYQEIKDTNERLKEEIKIKDSLISELKKELNILKEKVEVWKVKFQEISKKAGIKLMSALGVEKVNGVKNSYPEADVLKKIEGFKDNSILRDPRKFRVIPDKNNDSKFSVIYRMESGKYEVIEGNINTRNDAQKRIKELIVLNKALVEKVQKGISRE